jgi:hypothetical protein
MFQIKGVKAIKMHILCSITFSTELVPFIRKCRKMWCSNEGQDANMAARGILDN